MPPRLLAALVAALLAAGAAAAQEKPLAFTGARIIPIAGQPFDNGVLVVQGGRIFAVGPAASTAIPAGAEVRDARGKVIMPGLVDSHSHIGGASGAARVGRPPAHGQAAARQDQYVTQPVH